MPILLIILLVFWFNGDRRNIFSIRQFKIIKNVIIAIFLLNILGPLLGMTFKLLFMAGTLLFPLLFLGILGYILGKRNKGKGREGSYNQRNDATGNYYSNGASAAVDSGIIPKQASKRRKIVEKFNKKYELFLTESQIQRIVDASYCSYDWEREIADMNKEYQSVYQWMNGSTAWLRAYLKAFKIQNVSSDFRQQKQLCIDELNQIFRNYNFAGAYSIEAAIQEINEEFFTGFDDISFMIVYRFLEANGFSYDLSKTDVVRNEDETDILKEKYDKMTREF